MKNRFKELRKELNLTQEQFSDITGIPRSTIAGYERGKEPADGILSLICEKFNVNRKWLETGDEKETMFKPVDEHQAVRAMFEKMLNDAPPAKRAVLSAVIELFFTAPDQIWDDIVKKIHDAIEETNSAEALPPEPTIDEKVEAYRRELELEKRARERSGA